MVYSVALAAASLAILGNHLIGTVASPVPAPAAAGVDHFRQIPLQQQATTTPTLADLDWNVHTLSVQALHAFARARLEPELYDRLVQHVDSLPELRTIAVAHDRRIELTEGEKALLVYSGIRFDDITDSYQVQSPSNAAAEQDGVAVAGSGDDEWPKHWRFGKKELEKRFYAKIDTKRMMSWLDKFTSFRTRYYRSETGKQSQHWLLETVKSIAHAKPELHMTVREFPHPWGQNSIIASLPVAKGTKSKGKIVVGAHQDSTNLLPFLSAPGADDDGSGTVTVLEVLHTLVNVSHVPSSYSIEFHFYSAEEGGMLGSNAIAGDYQSKLHAGGKDIEPVRAMLQMDMTAYVKPGTKERIGIIQDFVDPYLTRWIEGLIGEVNDIPSVSTKCGYACSDHSAWTKIGVPSAFAIEATFEDSNTHNIHTSGDTYRVDGFSFDHMKQFVKLATAFLLELSE